MLQFEAGEAFFGVIIMTKNDADSPTVFIRKARGDMIV